MLVNVVRDEADEQDNKELEQARTARAALLLLRQRLWANQTESVALLTYTYKGKRGVIGCDKARGGRWEGRKAGASLLFPAFPARFRYPNSPASELPVKAARKRLCGGDRNQFQKTAGSRKLGKTTTRRSVPDNKILKYGQNGQQCDDTLFASAGGAPLALSTCKDQYFPEHFVEEPRGTASYLPVHQIRKCCARVSSAMHRFKGTWRSVKQFEQSTLSKKLLLSRAAHMNSVTRKRDGNSMWTLRECPPQTKAPIMVCRDARCVLGSPEQMREHIS